MRTLSPTPVPGRRKGSSPHRSRLATLLLVVTVSLAACERPPVNNTVVVGASTDVGVLLPVLAASSMTDEINEQLYLSLNSARWVDGALEYVIDELSLAERWQFSPDSTSLSYFLKDAVWSDGQPITAEDVVFTYDLIRNPDIASPRIDFWENLDSVVADNARQVTFHFTRRYPGMLLHTGVGIVPRHVFADYAENNATLSSHPSLIEPGGNLVVSGPFLVSAWSPGEQLVLSRNPGASTAEAQLDQVTFRFIPEETTRLVELENERVDVIHPAPADAVSDLEADGRFRIETVARRFYDYIGWNGAAFAPFNDAAVREALSLAIDRQEIIDGLGLTGYAEPAAGPYPPIFRKLADPGVIPDPYLPDSARALLAASGWRDTDGDGVLDLDGERLEFTLLTQATLKRRTSAAEIIQAQYREIGIDMQVREVEFNALLGMMFEERAFEAVLLGWQVGLEPDYVMGLFWPPDHPLNITGFRRPAVDSLIALTQSAKTEAEAIDYWKAIGHEISSHRPYAFLWFFDEMVAVNQRVRDTRIDTYGVFQNLHQWKVAR